MIPLLQRLEVRALDRAAIDALGVPGVVLMENAGAHAAALLLARFPQHLERVVVLGGTGQNGGDAWVVARHLLCQGVRPRCGLIGDRGKVSGDARVNLQALEALGVTVQVALTPHELLDLMRDATLLVDGLFGTGLDRPLAGVARECVELMNQTTARVVALDLPSGIDADSGQVLGAAVRAAMTVTFAAHKFGLHQFPGAAHAGVVECAGIGVPVARGAQGLIEAADVAELLPVRAADTHKGTHGHVLVIAGSPGKTGAAALCALGAARAGAGLVTIASDAETRRALDPKVLEIMTAALAPTDPLASALALCDRKQAAVIGPGLGVSAPSLAFARALACQLPVPCVVDADALTALAEDPTVLKTAPAPRVLTPHPGEAARMLGVTTSEIQAQRVEAARTLAARTGQVVVLKGARSVVAAPSGALRISTRGTPALGTGGTGDVLAGVIAALCVELSVFDAAQCGVELHARAGELAALQDRGLLASEVAHAIPRALAQCREQRAASRSASGSS